MGRALRLLIIEDVEDHALLIVRELQKGGFDPEFQRVETLQELGAALDGRGWDAVISDFNLPGFDGLDVLRTMQQKGLDLPFLLVSGAIGEERAAEVMKAGAHDYIRKGNYARLVAALERELRDAEVRHERRLAAEELLRHREHLEELVQERTEELTRANEALQAEIAERSRADKEIARLNRDLAARVAELEERNLELDAFNRTVSHDLRQPLNTIGIASQQIQILCSESLDEICTNSIAVTRQAILRMNTLIETLLKFASSTHGELHRETVDLAEMAMEIAEEARLAEPNRRVTFRCPETLAADADRNLLRTVLENVIGNAWKYTGSREEGVIEMGSVDIDGIRAYYVRDNGQGFDMADASDLFVPFKRLPMSEQFKGSGIGLATAERIIRRHGGRIWAEGEPDRGATFYFTLSSGQRDAAD